MKTLQIYLLCSFIALLFIPTSLQSQPPSGLQWKKFADINTKRSRFKALFISRNEILIFGGYADTLNGSQTISATSTEILNTDTRTSTYIQSSLSPHSEFASVITVDSNVIAIGGTTVPLISSTSTSLVEMFDRKLRTWKSLGNLIIARCQHEAILLNDHEILVVGGRGTNNSTLNSAEIFDITTGISKLTTPFPHYINNPLAARSSIGSALVFGGRSGGASSSQSDSVYKFDRATERWIGVSKTNDAITNAGVVKLSDGRVFMSGGFNEATRLPVISIHSETTDKFSQIGAMLLPRAWHSLVQYDSSYTIAIAGANSLSAITNSCEWIDFNTGVSSVAPSLAVSRYFGEVVSQPIIDGTGRQIAARVFMISGATAFGSLFLASPTSSVEILEPEVIIEYSPPVISAGGGDCRTYTFEINDPERITALQLDLAASDNVDLSFSPNLPATNVKVTITLRDGTRPGRFRITATNSRGKTASEERTLTGGSQLELQTDGTDALRDTVVAGQLRCRAVELVNPGNDTVRISQLFLRRNVEISLPGGGRADVIPPNGRLAVMICYAPSYYGDIADTLIIETPCAALKRPVAIVAVPDALNGKERCEIVIFADKYGQTELPYPNPASSFVRVPVPSPAVGVWVEDELGNRVACAVETVSGEAVIHLGYVRAGWYAVVVASPRHRRAYPVFVIR